MGSQISQELAVTTWRQRRRELQEIEEAVETERVRIGEDAHVTYMSQVPAKKRAKLPGRPSSYLELLRFSRDWVSALTAEQHLEIESRILELRARLQAEGDRLDAARGAVRSAAAAIPEPLAGPGATWRLIKARSVCSYGSQGLGAMSYARASAAMTARDLLDVGHKIRCVARWLPEDRKSYMGPISAFEVWAWTCEDGALIAAHQGPAVTLSEHLGRARDEGVNPAALLGVPIDIVLAAGADRCAPAGYEAPQPLTWEALSEGVELTGAAVVCGGSGSGSGQGAGTS